MIKIAQYINVIRNNPVLLAMTVLVALVIIRQLFFIYQDATYRQEIVSSGDYRIINDGRTELYYLEIGENFDEQDLEEIEDYFAEEHDIYNIYDPKVVDPDILEQIAEKLFGDQKITEEEYAEPAPMDGYPASNDGHID